jgi:hypothetical protein
MFINQIFGKMTEECLNRFGHSMQKFTLNEKSMQNFCSAGAEKGSDVGTSLGAHVPGWTRVIISTGREGYTHRYVSTIYRFFTASKLICKNVMLSAMELFLGSRDLSLIGNGMSDYTVNQHADRT